MKRMILIAAVATFAFSPAALAKPGNGHGNSHDGWNGGVGYGLGGCPPGLAKKHNVCMPPGQARKLARGQRWQNVYGSRYGFGQIPYDLRRRYDLDPTDRYYYGNGYLYQVDPRTQLVERVISALLRR